MADESAIIAEFLYNKLNVSAVLTALGGGARIYDTEVPQIPLTGQTVLYPCVVYQLQAASDVWGVGGVRIFVRPVWTVKAIVDDQDYKSAAAIFKTVDAALQNQSGTATDGAIYSCTREGDGVRYSEPKIGGGYYRHRGAMYRIEARATTTP